MEFARKCVFTVIAPRSEVRIKNCSAHTNENKSEMNKAYIFFLLSISHRHSVAHNI